MFGFGNIEQVTIDHNLFSQKYICIWFLFPQIFSMANRFFEGAAHAAVYARFRPYPPKSLIDNIISYLREQVNNVDQVC